MQFFRTSYFLIILSFCFGGCGGVLGTTPTYRPARTENITPIQPFQEGDAQLTCSELNREIGQLNERISRLIEQNEHAEARKSETSPYMGAFFSVLVAASQKISSAQDEPYGTDTGHLIQTYQERIEHLETLSKSKGC